MPLVLMRPVARAPRKPPGTFSVPGALAFVDSVLAGHPTGHLPRVPGRGVLYARFVLPLALLPTTNARAHQKPWALGAMKAKVHRMMWLQHQTIRSVPLPGRPFVRCVRFSTKEPDAFADWAKMAIDCLTMPRAPKKPGGRKKLGLGLLYDDAPKYVELAQPWWEKVSPGYGCCLIEVFAGAT